MTPVTPNTEIQNPAGPAPAISVVVPSYNRAHCILKTLDSIFAQTFTDYEVVIIDDGSTDNTSAVLEPVKDRIRYIQQKNGGLANARNRGIQEARGEWIAFLDSDDLWLPEKLAVQMEAVKRSPELAVHVTNASIFREHLGDELNLFELSNFRSADGSSPTRLEAPFIPAISYGLSWMQCALVRRSTFLKAGDFLSNLRIFMDFELGTRLALLGPWEVCHQQLVRILRQDDGEVASISSHAKTPKGRLELIETYRLMSSREGLSPKEKAFIQRRLSDTQGSVGLRLVLKEDVKEGRELLKKSFTAGPRAGSFLRLGVAWLPGLLRRPLIRRLFPHAAR